MDFAKFWLNLDVLLSYSPYARVQWMLQRSFSGDSSVRFYHIEPLAFRYVVDFMYGGVLIDHLVPFGLLAKIHFAARSLEISELEERTMQLLSRSGVLSGAVYRKESIVAVEIARSLHHADEIVDNHGLATINMERLRLLESPQYVGDFTNFNIDMYTTETREDWDRWNRECSDVSKRYRKATQTKAAISRREYLKEDVETGIPRHLTTVGEDMLHTSTLLGAGSRPEDEAEARRRQRYQLPVTKNDRSRVPKYPTNQQWNKIRLCLRPQRPPAHVPLPTWNKPIDSEREPTRCRKRRAQDVDPEILTPQKRLKGHPARDGKILLGNAGAGEGDSNTPSMFIQQSIPTLPADIMPETPRRFRKSGGRHGSGKNRPMDVARMQRVRREENRRRLAEQEEMEAAARLLKTRYQNHQRDERRRRREQQNLET